MIALIKVGIYGASGYMGGKALRVLNEHRSIDTNYQRDLDDRSLFSYAENK